MHERHRNFDHRVHELEPYMMAEMNGTYGEADVLEQETDEKVQKQIKLSRARHVDDGQEKRTIASDLGDLGK
jgi:hypothetical protein